MKKYRNHPFFRALQNYVTFFLLVAVQSLLFCVMFMYLPGRNNGFRESLP